MTVNVSRFRRTAAVFLLPIMTLRPVLPFSVKVLRTALRQETRIRHFAAGNLDDLISDLLEDPTPPGGTPSQSRRSPTKNGWKEVDWTSVRSTSSNRTYDDSPVDVKMVLGKIIHIKRDDQLRLKSGISGNKARKMSSLEDLEPFPRCIVSYGGPQSNAMVALAAVVHFHNIKCGFLESDEQKHQFVYYTKRLPRFLRTQPSGNLFRAQSLGMQLRELSNDEYNDLFGGDAGGSLSPPPLLNPPYPEESVWIPQGGGCEAAVAGTEKLANEILAYWSLSGSDRPLTVILPGGTCSTAALLHWAIKQNRPSHSTQADIIVVVIPCVGDASYARRQMESLFRQMGIDSDIPNILPPSPGSTQGFDYFSFGEPDKAILETYTRMRDENDIVLDLLYGAPAWTILLRHLKPSKAADRMLSGRELMYVHSGGLEGINSQQLRYKYKGFLDIEDVQLPGKGRDRD